MMKGVPMCRCVEQVATEAHVKSEETLKAEVPHREPEPGSARSLAQQDKSMSSPPQDGHTKDIETGCADPVSSASSAADQGAESEQRGAVAILLFLAFLWPSFSCCQDIRHSVSVPCLL